MDIQTLERRITELVEPELIAKQFELFSVRLGKKGKRRLISLAIDRAEGGVTIDECAAWNRQFNDRIEAENLIEGDYVVEVASPGIDRPLVAEKDYRRLSGKKIWFQYRNADSKLVESIRVLVGVADGKLVLGQDGSPETSELPLESIVSAKPEVLMQR